MFTLQRLLIIGMLLLISSPSLNMLNRHKVAISCIILSPLLYKVITQKSYPLKYVIPFFGTTLFLLYKSYESIHKKINSPPDISAKNNNQEINIPSVNNQTPNTTKQEDKKNDHHDIKIDHDESAKNQKNLLKIIEEEYHAYRSKQSNKDENFSLYFGGESNKEKSLEELRSILTPLSDFFSKNNQRSPQDLHTFCGICTNGLGLEYLLLNILKKIGYTNINKVYIVDILYENSGTEFKQVIDKFQESVKGLFSTSSVTALTNCQQLRENNLKNTFFFYRHCDGEEGEINMHIFNYMSKDSIIIYHSVINFTLPNMNLEEQDIIAINKNFKPMIPFNQSNQFVPIPSYLHIETIMRNYSLQTIYPYKKLKEITLFFQIFAQFLKNIEQNRSQLKNDIKIFVRNGNRWIKEMFNTVFVSDQNEETLNSMIQLSCSYDEDNEENFKWCKSNLKIICEEIDTIIK